MIRLFKVLDGVVIEEEAAAGDRAVHVPGADWDTLWNSPTRAADLAAALAGGAPTDSSRHTFLAPIGAQEVWAAGVTYKRSRQARMEESADAGGSDFYDKVYTAHRPELFFKATPHRVAGPGEELYLRSDSKWNVPEPELTLALDRRGDLVGFTIGNDLSSRDIEGENPLYLPQAKVWGRCAALGPCVVVTGEEPPPDTGIRMVIERDGQELFAGSTTLAAMKQSLGNLREHLFRDNAFPQGVFLMTGTGIVPGDDVSLRVGDRIAIGIDGVGTLPNVIGVGPA